jgi:CxxC-x17-CxxC domain-containing protein
VAAHYFFGEFHFGNICRFVPSQSGIFFLSCIHAHGLVHGGRIQGQVIEGDVWALRVSARQRRAVHFSGDGVSRAWVKGASHMEFQDKVLKCIDCGADFVFTAGEQLFFHDKQFKNEPKRCKSCKTKRVAVLGATPAPNNYNKVETRTVCSQCGKETTVPFKPTQGRPVFCRECFQQRRQAATA